MPGDATEEIDVARDQRTFRHDPETQPFVLGEHLENAPRDPEAPLSGLVRIRRRADADPLSSEKIEVLVGTMAQRLAKHLGRVLLHEDLPLEREPGRERLERFTQETLFEIGRASCREREERAIHEG